MNIAMIAAMAKNRIIGAKNSMPWHLPADLRHFKSVTMGKPIVMGRKTYESIGRPLPGRPNIVISQRSDLALPDGVVVVPTPEEALNQATTLQDQYDEVVVIGGGTIYSHLLPAARTLYLTHIDLEVEGDTQFPEYETTDEWVEISREAHLADDKNPYNYSFATLRRNTPDE